MSLSFTKTKIGKRTKNMFYSQLLLSKKGPLGTIWIAAHCHKRLKKEQVQQTDIASSVGEFLLFPFSFAPFHSQEVVTSKKKVVFFMMVLCFSSFPVTPFLHLTPFLQIYIYLHLFSFFPRYIRLQVYEVSLPFAEP